MSSINLNAIIVIYNKKIEECPTYIGVEHILSETKAEHIHKVYIFDNSTDKDIREHNQQFINAQQLDVIKYITLFNNVGLAKAYNTVLKMISEDNSTRFDLSSKWLLILDQDTELTKEYIEAFYNEYQNNSKIGSYVPRIYGKHHIISPLKVNRKYFGDSFDMADQEPSGLLTQRFSAINSCSIINVGVLKELNGFNENFPIDYLDYYTYYAMWKKGYLVYCLDVDINHDLSFDTFGEVGFGRYKIFLNSQSEYVYEVEKNSKKMILLASFHNYRRHALRTLRNRRLIFFVKGSLISAKNVIRIINKK
ncbi:glycosyltransferase [Bacillus sp. EAC]|uniref:glycosyltransferase n=1 Tax=Bacillus sp. EAC TaxID=1978338 RepID=UPI000B44BEDE|nr:glycosyltransferase [Bacillus sp. EAC]